MLSSVYSEFMRNQHDLKKRVKKKKKKKKKCYHASQHVIWY